MGASPARFLEQVRDPAIGQDRDAVERKRRSSAVAQQSLASLVVVGFDAHGTMHIEAFP
jgi:hypothetical protein